MKPLGRLLRLSLAPTAAADVAAGTVAGAGAWPGGMEPWLLVLGSLCVYHGGMVLNDWADRGEDARTRPDRPIPSGAVPVRAALLLGLALLVAGPLVALLAAPRCASLLAAVAVAALVYDLGPRGPLTGPLLLGGCRAGNLAAGLLLGSGGLAGGLALLPALLYGGYVFCVSRVARLEDAPAGDGPTGSARSSPALHLTIATVFLAAAPSSALLHPMEARLRMWAALVLAAAGGAGLVEAALRTPGWTPQTLTRVTGLALRRLLVFTAAVALSAGGTDGWLVAGAILAGYPVSFFLRGVFPPS